nr:immunoglobulin light chain junction region [Macaca mulatta]
CQQYNDLVLSF